MEKPDVLSEYGRANTRLIFKTNEFIYLTQQARQDTAREIFKEIEKQSIDGGVTLNVYLLSDDYQRIKSKFLIPPNPVGSADL